MATDLSSSAFFSNAGVLRHVQQRYQHYREDSILDIDSGLEIFPFCLKKAVQWLCTYVKNLGAFLCHSLKTETRVWSYLTNSFLRNSDNDKKWMRERWIARFVGCLNCPLSYPVLSRGNFSAGVPSSSSEELPSFSCSPKKQIIWPAVAISFFLSDGITLSWKLDLIFTELYSAFHAKYNYTLEVIILWKQGILWTSHLLLFSCHLKSKRKRYKAVVIFKHSDWSFCH